MHELSLYYLRPDWCDEAPKVAGNFNGWQWMDMVPCPKPWAALTNGPWFSALVSCNGQVEFKFIAKSQWVGDRHQNNFVSSTSAAVAEDTLTPMPEKQVPASHKPSEAPKATGQARTRDSPAAKETDTMATVGGHQKHPASYIAPLPETQAPIEVAYAKDQAQLKDSQAAKGGLQAYGCVSPPLARGVPETAAEMQLPATGPRPTMDNALNAMASGGLPKGQPAHETSPLLAKGRPTAQQPKESNWLCPSCTIL